ncbi:PIN domain-containing protein [Geodermatophilus sp. DF01-2]|uniref:type II toxin-antitoxin system VapC family toxin n=1 Tax=Geodermatophilus sp. DF01-2 TaxID=2559610 RepID=UPI001073AE79|nr:PIN domain-containing protein [Geodermatophilus sp. DF01_2]TFV56258.1 PIN domain-containing protein [Geodermatophilus sp. DF01_2]
MSATFDTGMLIALDRNEREAWTVLRRLVDRGEVPIVPTIVTAQAWRDGRRQARLAQALHNCRPDPLGDDVARRAGELCGRAGTSDVVDAVVIATARRRGDDVYTSDIDDLEHLADHITRAITIVPIGH